MTQLARIPEESLEQAWPIVAGMAATIAETSRGRVAADHIKGGVERGTYQLWAVLDDAGRDPMAVVVTEVIAYPLSRVCVVRGLAGHDRGKWMHHLAEIEDWARSHGCARMEVRGRKGMAKVLPDYKLTSVFLEKAL